MATFHFGTQDVSYDGPWFWIHLCSGVGEMCADLAVKYSQWLGHLTVLLGLAQASHNSDGEWIMDGLGPNIMRYFCCGSFPRDSKEVAS